MKYSAYIWMFGIVSSFLIFMCNKNIVIGKEKTETVYYYIVQPKDNLWKISEELYGNGSYWQYLYSNNQHIFDPSLIYPGMKLEITKDAFPENFDERFLTEKRKVINFQWLQSGYIHFNCQSTERSEYPKKVEEEVLTSLKEGSVSEWLSELSEPRLLTEEEKEAYRKKDVENILYSYEIERGLPEDRWYLLTEDNGSKWLIIENQERGKRQEFYCFIIDSSTDEISLCEKIHGAGGRLYLTSENKISVWIMTKEIDGEVIGIAGDYRGYIYIGGNFYYEKQQNGTIKGVYQSYSSIGSGTLREEGATTNYPY